MAVDNSLLNSQGLFNQVEKHLPTYPLMFVSSGICL